MHWPQAQHDTAMEPLPSRTGGSRGAVHDDFDAASTIHEHKFQYGETQSVMSSSVDLSRPPEEPLQAGDYYDNPPMHQQQWNPAYDPYSGNVPQAFSPNPDGRRSPGANLAYGAAGGRTSPGPNVAYGGRTSPGPNVAYGGRTSPGPNAAYAGGRTSPGPNVAYAGGRTSPGPNAAYGAYGGRVSPGPNVAYASSHGHV